ncbi:MAG: zinc-ribbon domain-containing protein [Bacteroidetes bacterium HGW-Bacteroidetes-17]|nr:MAG: zinc-ribbon domain-containing protein [Bacteroidetes bacterium HGW-Bacteroidetes-17]
MFVIFGFGDQHKKQYQLTKTEHCYHCNNTSRWIITKTTDHFSLFFLPVFPYKTKYFYHCSICNHGKEISEEQFEQLKDE